MSKPKVLVSDAEPGILSLVADARSIRGFEAHAAASPWQALDIVKTLPCFDLLLSDVMMPEVCGPELVRKIAQICPTTAIVMMSAYINVAELPRLAGFISKPFLVTDLYSVVDKTLARGAAAAGA